MIRYPQSWLVRCLLVALPALPTGSYGADAATPVPMAQVIADDFAFASAQYTGMLARLKGDPLLPRSFRDGQVVTVLPRDWTSGFFGGSLWLIYDFTREERWKTAAQDYTARIESIKNFTDHHDVGFMLYCSYGTGLRITNDSAYGDVLRQGAESLATRFNPNVGAIKSWDGRRWPYPVIVDNMMNLELLLWAAKNGGNARLRDIAISHADKTLAHHFRPDGSSYHVVDYDPDTGVVRARQTHQGNADDSAWARGQSWGFYGYTMMARETGRAEYLAQAKKIATFLLKHPRLPEDKIPYWDYDDPRIPSAPRDTSAAAIMASALIDLSSLVEPQLAREYLAVAEQQLRALSSPRYRAPIGENGNFLLMHGVGHRPAWSEVEAPLIYGDYYFLEALLRLRAKLAP